MIGKVNDLLHLLPLKGKPEGVFINRHKVGKGPLHGPRDPFAAPDPAPLPAQIQLRQLVIDPPQHAVKFRRMLPPRDIVQQVADLVTHVVDFLRRHLFRPGGDHQARLLPPFPRQGVFARYGNAVRHHVGYHAHAAFAVLFHEMVLRGPVLDKQLHRPSFRHNAQAKARITAIGHDGHDIDVRIVAGLSAQHGPADKGELGPRQAFFKQSSRDSDEVRVSFLHWSSPPKIFTAAPEKALTSHGNLIENCRIAAIPLTRRRWWRMW